MRALVALQNGHIALSLGSISSIGLVYSSIEIRDTVHNNSLMYTLTSPYEVSSMVMVNNQYLVTGDSNGNIKILDCNTPNYTAVASWQNVNSQGWVLPVSALAFDPNLGVLASAGSMTIQIWQFEFLKTTTTMSTTTSTTTKVTTKPSTNPTTKPTTKLTTKLTTKATTKSSTNLTSQLTTQKSTVTYMKRFNKLLKIVRSQGKFDFILNSSLC